MPNRLRKRSQQNFYSAIASLEQAFRDEATRQREQVIEQARIIALQNRATTIQSNPLSWPATMMMEMETNNNGIIVYDGSQARRLNYGQ